MSRPRLAPNRTRRRRALLLLAGTLPLGLAWRLAPLHLPRFAFKYGGSVLWAAAVYWLLAALLPRWRVPPLAALAACVAASVELLKLFRWPPLDRFRETLAGKLLLGRYFTWVPWWPTASRLRQCPGTTQRPGQTAPKSHKLPPRR